MRSLDQLVETAADVAGSSTPEGRLLLLATLRQQVDVAMVATLGDIEASPGAVRLDGGIDGGQWLAARTDLHPAEIKTLAGLARVLPDMPATCEAYEAGRLGTEKVRLLRSATGVEGFEEAEPGLVERVASASLRMAKRIIGRFVVDHTEGGSGVDDPSANEVTLSPKRNGRWKLHGDIDAATAAVILNELRRLADAHRDDDEELSTARRMALALFDMARRSVTLGERGPGSRPELVIVADAGLFGELFNERYEDGTPVTRTVFETLSCDATVRGLLANGPSEVLDLGRSQRLGSPGQRRAASVRDGGCVYPGCDRSPEECDLHHIRHWLKHQGRTDLANLCLLCRRHHTLTHAIGFTFRRRADGFLMIYRPDGTPLGDPARSAA